MKSHHSFVFATCLVAVSAACGVLTPFVWGQGAKAPSEDELPRIVAYKLRYLPSQSAAEELRQLFGSGPEDASKIVPDLVGNSLLVRASSREHAMIKEVLELVDVEAPQEQAPLIKIFNLQFARASELSAVIKAVTEAHDVRLAIDQRTNAVIAVGRTEGMTILSAVLERLDEPLPDAKRSLQPLRVRIFWLVEGSEQEKLAAPPAELRGVVDELTRLGFQDLRRVSQILVHIDAKNSQFQAAGNADLGGKVLRLSAEGAAADGPNSGQMELADGQVRLNLSITVADHVSDERLCSLSAELTTSLGHSTVLGTTPLGQKSAVFVVQVLPSEK
jgi:hypothetical protein